MDWASAAAAGTNALINAGMSLYGANRSSNYMSAMMHQNEQFTQDMYALQYRHAMEAEQRADRRYYEQMDYGYKQQKELAQYLFDNFESPAAQVAALRRAGINPSAVFGGSASPYGSVSAPSLSGASPFQGGVPSPISQGLPSAMPFNGVADSISQGLASLGSFLRDYSQSEINDVNVDRLIATQNSYIREQYAKANLAELTYDHEQLFYMVDRMYKDKEKRAELKLTLNRAFAASAEGHYTEAQEILVDTMSDLNRQKWFLQNPYCAHALELFQTTYGDMEAQRRLHENQGTESYHNSRMLRVQADVLDLQEEIANMDNESFDNYRKKAPEKTRGLIEMARNQNLISQSAAEEANKKINRAQAYNNLPEWSKDMISVTEFLLESLGGAASAGVGAYVGAKVRMGPGPVTVKGFNR